jgi:hypothetical protein
VSWVWDWFARHEALVLWLTGLSVISFVATLVLVPWLIVRLPADYFLRERRERRGHRHPVLHAAVLAARNVLGLAFVLVGLALLALPGQGLLTILAGISLMSFPGKFRLERWTVTRPPLLAAVNWLRRRAGRPELLVN